MAILAAYVCYVRTSEAVKKSHLLLNNTKEGMIGLCPFIICQNIRILDTVSVPFVEKPKTFTCINSKVF